MKKTVLILIIIVVGFSSRAQNMQITSSEITTVDGGINVNLQTITGNGAGFINYSYIVTENVVDLNVCYWFNLTLPVLTFSHDFFIPLSATGNYTINTHIFMSESTETCDNFSNPANSTQQHNYLSSAKHLWNAVKVFPNPTSGALFLEGLDAEINGVEVYDILGKNIKNQFSKSQNKIDLSGIPEGIYFLKIETNQGVLNRKIIIKND
jgi:hypothetical protein